MGITDQKKIKVILKSAGSDQNSKKPSDSPVNIKSSKNDLEAEIGLRFERKIAALNEQDSQTPVQTAFSNTGDSNQEIRELGDANIKGVADGEIVENVNKNSAKSAKKPNKHKGQADVDANALQELMGFSGFGTTKNKKIESNIRGIVKVTKKKHDSGFRQYMNREKGFNRPLSPPRSSKKK